MKNKHSHSHANEQQAPANAAGKYYCPMHCEGDKVYDKPGNLSGMPWMVAFFGFLVIPLGVTSIVLIILQPVAVGFWCSVCLLTAVAMLIMVPLTLDEVVAMIQFFYKRVKSGKPFWRTFWKGDTIEGEQEDNRTPGFLSPLKKTIPASLWGVNLPWNLLLSVVIGLRWMFYPGNFGIEGSAANNFTTLGALVVTFSVIAMAEVGRALRFINIAFAAWLIVALCKFLLLKRKLW